MEITGYKSTPCVLGFAFDASHNVGLIRKMRPPWQKGSLNGIGGHIEEGESPHDAQVREFLEETGLYVPTWEEVCVMGNDSWNVKVYKAFDVPLEKLRTMTDEEVEIYPALDLPDDVLFNLRWLIPLAIDPQPFPPIVMYR